MVRFPSTPHAPHILLVATLVALLMIPFPVLVMAAEQAPAVSASESASTGEAGGLFRMFSGDPKNAVDLGKRLGLDYFVMGSVGQLDRTYILNAHLFSVSTGELVPGTQQTKFCTRVEDLYPCMESVGRFMAYQVAERARKP